MKRTTDYDGKNEHLRCGIINVSQKLVQSGKCVVQLCQPAELLLSKICTKESVGIPGSSFVGKSFTSFR